MAPMRIDWLIFTLLSEYSSELCLASQGTFYKTFLFSLRCETRLSITTPTAVTLKKYMWRVWCDITSQRWHPFNLSLLKTWMQWFTNGLQANMWLFTTLKICVLSLKYSGYTLNLYTRSIIEHRPHKHQDETCMLWAIAGGRWVFGGRVKVILCLCWIDKSA